MKNISSEGLYIYIMTQETPKFRKCCIIAVVVFFIILGGCSITVIKVDEMNDERMQKIHNEEYKKNLN